MFFTGKQAEVVTPIFVVPILKFALLSQIGLTKKSQGLKGPTKMNKLKGADNADCESHECLAKSFQWLWFWPFNQR